MPSEKIVEMNSSTSGDPMKSSSSSYSNSKEARNDGDGVGVAAVPHSSSTSATNSNNPIPIPSSSTDIGGAASSSSNSSNDIDFGQYFPSAFHSPQERTQLRMKIERFLMQHYTTAAATSTAGSDTNQSSSLSSLFPLQRPIAIVTSGGTAVDIDGGVRCIENFSTGLRGAISVEELLLRGYIVIHLWRIGSISPFARILSQSIQQRQRQPTKSFHGFTLYSLSHLFAYPYRDDDENNNNTTTDEDGYDPWFTSRSSSTNRTNTTHTTSGHDTNTKHDDEYHYDSNNSNRTNNDIKVELHPHIQHSTSIQSMLLNQYQCVIQEHRLLTIPFRSVQEYIAQLQLCAQLVSEYHTFVIFLLAAAVSDYYIPDEERPQHKLTSNNNSNNTSTNHHHDDNINNNNQNNSNNSHPDSNNSNNIISKEEDGGLILRLKPVPKTLGLLRTIWAPNAFVVSFKLETDISILQQQAERAVQKYGCHMVIGNILQQRHDQIYILAPMNYIQQNPNNVLEWPRMMKLTRNSTSSNMNSILDDSLEKKLIDVVMNAHFEYISYHFHSTIAKIHHGYSSTTNNDDNNNNTINPMVEQLATIQKIQQQIQEKQQRLQREIAWKHIQRMSWDVLCTVAAVVVSYSINSALQRRIRS